ncbi:MAG: hypothetical protein ACD_5C00167G0002 [uncultured bacterium]|nr:MAG: hypothetical protein ACD_5C00167G0002 [uncultured bacterium]
MTKLSEDIIGKIKCDRITPVPKWHFLLKGYSLWVLFSTSVILGSLSFSVIMHIIKSGDLYIVNHLQGGWILSAVMLLPVFWLISLLFFAILAFINWKCTKRGYCTRRRWLVLGSVVISIFFGGIFYLFGLGKKTDNAMSKALPFYDEYKHKARRDLWQHPEKGFLTGKIIDIDEETEKLLVRDEDGKEWIVNDRDIKWENTQLEERGKIIKVMGTRNGPAEFEAVEIRRCNNCQDDEFIEDTPPSLCLKQELPRPVPGCAK